MGSRQVPKATPFKNLWPLHSALVPPAPASSQHRQHRKHFSVFLHMGISPPKNTVSQSPNQKDAGWHCCIIPQRLQLRWAVRQASAKDSPPILGKTACVGGSQQGRGSTALRTPLSFSLISMARTHLYALCLELSFFKPPGAGRGVPITDTSASMVPFSCLHGHDVPVQPRNGPFQGKDDTDPTSL